MPIYTYHCSNCGVQFEVKQHFDDEPLIRCLECGEETLHKVYLPVGIVFKGSGFYSTDNRSPSGNIPERSHKTDKNKESKNKNDSKTTDNPSN